MNRTSIGIFHTKISTFAQMPKKTHAETAKNLGKCQWIKKNKNPSKLTRSHCIFRLPRAALFNCCEQQRHQKRERYRKNCIRGEMLDNVLKLLER
jgi:hypothetical protein